MQQQHQQQQHQQPLRLLYQTAAEMVAAKTAPHMYSCCSNRCERGRSFLQQTLCNNRSFHSQLLRHRCHRFVCGSDSLCQLDPVIKWWVRGHGEYALLERASIGVGESWGNLWIGGVDLICVGLRINVYVFLGFLLNLRRMSMRSPPPLVNSLIRYS